MNTWIDTQSIKKHWLTRNFKFKQAAGYTLVVQYTTPGCNEETPVYRELPSDWLTLHTWPEYRALIGCTGSRDRDTVLWLAGGNTTCRGLWVASGCPRNGSRKCGTPHADPNPPTLLNNIKSRFPHILCNSKVVYLLFVSFWNMLPSADRTQK